MTEESEETVLYIEHRYVCSECNQLYGSLEEVLMHQNSHVPQQHFELVGVADPGVTVAAEAASGTGLYQTLVQESQYQCLECGQLLMSPSQLLEHQELHLKMMAPQEAVPAEPAPKAPALSSSTIHYECVDCKALFASQELWLNHRQTHLRATPTKPPTPVVLGSPVVVGSPVGQTRVAVEHSYRKAEEGGEGAAVPSAAATTTEVVTEVELLLYKCSECSQLFQLPADFLEHQATHFPAPAPESEEPVLQQETLTPAPVEVPVSQPEPVPSSDHSYELRNGEALGRDRRGRRARRNNSGEPGGAATQELFCSACDQLFLSPHQLQQHLRSHREGVFKCPLCSRVFPSPSSLDQHLGDHSSESHFLCVDCGLAFGTEALLLAHRRAHTPNPLHSCPCGKTFVNLTKFLYHRRTHGVGGVPLPTTPVPPEERTSQAPPPPRRSAPRPGRAELGRARAMLLTVYCVRRDLSEVTFSLQVDADFELHNFRALCELESGIPAAESQIVYAERPLTDNHRSLASYGLKDGDVVILRQKENADPRPSVQFPNLPRIDFRSIAVPGTSNTRQRQPPGVQQSHSAPGEIASSPQGLDNPALLRDMLLANPHELSLLKERNPPLADALLSGDLERFSRVLVEQQQDRARREQERIRLFSADPFDLEAQAKIEEDIRQQNIEENMTIAMEEAPESFGQVVMLYINCKVNGHPVKAFVDSGAQMTIMSQACAERCNIMRLVDRRWAGIAKGVGTQKIIGRVHLAQVQIEGDFLACSFSILEEQPMDMLLGLDMLKRHQCSIDLKKNVLVIGTTGSKTTFLPEGELPECARLAYGAGRDEVRPEEIADQELAEALQKSVEDAEKSGKETTSLGMSSLPTSDGFNHQAHPPGLSPEIGNPASLAHSVSASVSPIQPSDPDSIEPKAVKALKASAEFQITSEQKEHLPPQDLSDCAPSADSAPANQSPAMPLQNSLEEAIVADHLEKSAERSTQGLKSHLHTRQEASLSVTTTGMQEPQRLAVGRGWHPECQDPSQVSGLQQHEEPRNEQHEVIQQSASHDQDHLCHTGDLELLGERQQSSAGLEAAMKGDRLQQNVDLPGTGKDALPSRCLGCSNSETLMEVDVVEQSLVAMRNSGGQNTTVKNIGASDLILDNPLMEVETSKYNPSSEISSNSISTQDLQLLESNVEMSEISKECGDHPSSLVSLCGSCQPSIESTEESCSSITAALKELHELLVISSKPASENTSEEGICQSETVIEGQTGIKDLSERWTQNERHRATQSEQCSQASCHQAVSVSVKTEESPDTLAAAGVEDVDTVNLRGPGDGLLTDKEGVPKPKESVNKSSSVTVASAEASNQLHCTLGVEISPRLLADEEDTLDQTSEQTESSSPACILVKDLGQGTQNPVTDRPEAEEHVCPEAAGQLLEFEPSTSHPSPSPSFLAPLIFPAADIDRILHAGFTLQEALGALHQVGGNADLALLVLLAKNIVVPT